MDLQSLLMIGKTDWDIAKRSEHKRFMDMESFCVPFFFLFCQFREISPQKFHQYVLFCKISAKIGNYSHKRLRREGLQM